MAIADSVTRLAASLLAILQTRLELISVEAEEEALRYFSYLILALAAMFCLGIAALLAVLLVIVLYWDSNRVGVILALMAFFSLVGVLIGVGIRNGYRHKPRLMAHTMAEISKDIHTLHPPG
jgi:uncharacterized membrane protein YqjE